MRFFHTQPEKGSEFKLAVLKTDSFSVLHQAYIKLFQKYPAADHIAVASIIKQEEEFNDNGEFGSGYRMLRCLKQLGAQNTAVFMIRFFGGRHLGPRRFTIITDMVTAAIEKINDQPTQTPVHSSPAPSADPSSKPSRKRASSNESSTSEQEIIEEQQESDSNTE